MHLLTIDLGTTLFKFALFDEQGRLCALRRSAPPIAHPQPSWWELDPRQFRRTIVQGIAALRSQMGGSLNDVAAISFATQANSFVLLDRRLEPLTPLILWPDERAMALAERLGPLNQHRDLTGVAWLSHQFALAKLLWLREHQGNLWRDAARLCFISDLLTVWFSGQHVTEAGVAALSACMDVQRLCWIDSILEEMGIPQNWLGRIARAGTDLGPILPEVAEELALPSSCRLVVGCLDQYAGAIGTGTIRPGRVSETTGTVLAVVGCTDRFAQAGPSPGVFRGPAFDPALFFHMSFSSTSANLLEWYRNQLPDRPGFEALEALAAEEADDHSIVIEPFVEGEPIDRCFRHVRPEHRPGQVVRAIMQRVARSLAEQVRTLCPDRLPEQISSAGGGARSGLWEQIKANTLGVRFVVTDCAEPTSLGAAMLAARALRWEPSGQLPQSWVRPGAVFEPAQRGNDASARCI